MKRRKTEEEMKTITEVYLPSSLQEPKGNAMKNLLVSQVFFPAESSNGEKRQSRSERLNLFRQVRRMGHQKFLEWTSLPHNLCSPMAPHAVSAASNAECLWKSTAAHSCKSPESKTASPCLLAVRHVAGWTSLSVGWEDAK